MAALAAEADAAGECLRYVGVVDVKAGKGSVELRRYPKVCVCVCACVRGLPAVQLRVYCRVLLVGGLLAFSVGPPVPRCRSALHAPPPHPHLAPQDHPFAQLSGSDNIIAFTTQRYSKQPLIVRGPGAGAEVTAGGVFSDLLRLAAYLGAPS
jgi:aspartokinase/homoserine dehydrogenase 1